MDRTSAMSPAARGFPADTRWMRPQCLCQETKPRPPLRKCTWSLASSPLLFQQRRFKESRYSFEILGRIHAERLVFCFDHADRIAVLQRPQLLQPLGLLEGTHRKPGIGKQEIAPEHIKTNMFVMNRAAMRYRAARKINGIAPQIADHLHDIRILDLTGIFDPLTECRHGDIRI